MPSVSQGLYRSELLTFDFSVPTLENSAMERDLTFLVNDKLNLSQHALAARRANHVREGIRHSITSQSREGIVPLCSALGQPHLEYCVQFWAPQYKKDIKLFESIQRARKMVKGLEGKPYEEWLRSLTLFGLEKRRMRVDLIMVYSFLMRGSREAGIDLFSVVTSGRNQVNGLKVCQGKFRY
ncbi:hypothetical protein WISP_112912 [Willisornis vidua]|uniref:Uncharacterized protein n=1 Tax=Willisornis vidua TaxID=1566151 RepID=A0ABQ9CUX6_9PASS|nr:hypothetical protein WISP_112912 [Willisornis vidua]